MPSNSSSTVEDVTSDIVHSILQGTPFKLRSDDEKLAILQKGRPVFSLTVITQSTSKNSSKTLNSSWYGIYKWLCGSTKYNKFFCWPCLLMRPETSTWCSIGNDDLTRFSSLATKHARCKSHLKALCEYDETLTNLKVTPESINESKFKYKEHVFDKPKGDKHNDEDNDGDVDDDDNDDDDDDDDDDNDEENDDDDDEENDDEDEDNDEDDDEDDDSVSLFSKAKDNKGNMNEGTSNSKTKVTILEPPKAKGHRKSPKITFKRWKKLYKDTFPVSKTNFFQDSQLYNWNKRIAKQELRNARLVGEKLKYEIKLLKTKLEYYKALNLKPCLGELPHFPSLAAASSVHEGIRNPSQSQVSLSHS